tara:strand:+ start:11179 stop:11409 length:231 start_codon:yes stop_codon:yes gene_type:complete
MGFFSIFKKEPRAFTIENKVLNIVDSITEDYNNFSPVEQAQIVKCINIEFLKRLQVQYDEAYTAQHEVLTAKELIK